MATNITTAELQAKMQALQSQIDNLDKLRQNTNASALQPAVDQTAAPTSTYPRVIRTDTVEDILENPQWKQELAVEFNSSELGVKAKNYTELLFMEFCEKQTGKPSTMLTDMRKSAAAQKKNKSSAPAQTPGKLIDDAKG